jgi:membrane protein DedA with SNARE-associated domain
MTGFFLEHGSYVAIVVVLVLTGAGLPIPEEVPIVTAGILSAHGQLNPWLALVCCLIGALAGDGVMYWIGYHFGRNVLREHHWWTRFVKPSREAQIEQMIGRHGLKVLFLARFLVGLRSPVYLSAGILRVPFRRFLLIDLFCATTVIGTFFALSYRYGTVIVRWIRRIEISLSVVVVLVLIVVVVYFWRRHRRSPAEVDSESNDCADPGQPPADPVLPVPEQVEQPVGNVEEVA